ncbi:MAG: hypothetical protein WBD20_03880, partial [Pirellulaceae bacterium]
TVALFVLCRYQLAGSVKWIAAVILGWYVVLTFTEIAMLAHSLPQDGVISPTNEEAEGNHSDHESGPSGLNAALVVAMAVEA